MRSPTAASSSPSTGWDTKCFPGASRVTPGIEFWGASFVADPNGRILVQGGRDEAVLTADCDLAQVDVVRTHWPFLRDRRIDAYSGLTQRYLD